MIKNIELKEKKIRQMVNAIKDWKQKIGIHNRLV